MFSALCDNFEENKIVRVRLCSEGRKVGGHEGGGGGIPKIKIKVGHMPKIQINACCSSIRYNT